MPENILNDPFPVLFEGIHSTDMLPRCREANKKVLFRAHNIEHDYYSHLAKSETNLFRKIFFAAESKKLKDHEEVLKYADHILCISKHETGYFEEKYGNALFIPAFHMKKIVQITEGSGSYILYHGNLSVSENIEAVRYIARKITSKTSFRFVVAGRAPSSKLRRWLESFQGIEVVPDPDEETMNRLIRNAHINILFTFQPTGLKLKLLHSLYSGRHCLVNPGMVKGTGLEEACHVVSNADQATRMIRHLMGISFTEEDIHKRRDALSGFSNRENAEKIIRLLD